VATQITQIDLPDRHSIILRVEGEMLLEDAVLLEKVATCLRNESGDKIVIDLAHLDFLDSDSASILKRIEDLDGFDIEGVEIFLQSAVNKVERASSAT
jgi:anti-anti-sigma regulatory factor